MVSDASTSSVIVLPVTVFAKICIPPRKRCVGTSAGKYLSQKRLRVVVVVPADAAVVVAVVVPDVYAAVVAVVVPAVADAVNYLSN